MNRLFSLLYNSTIQLYRLAIGIASIWDPKAKEWLQGRKNQFINIENSLAADEYRVWFHCASAGEFEQGRPVIEAYRRKWPHHKIVLTFFSPSGYELRKNYSGADYIFYLPLDTKSNAQQLIALIQPRLAIFVKYEFWYYHLKELKKLKIPVVLISGIFRSNQVFFKWYGKPLQASLRCFQQFFVQDESSLQLLKQNGFTNAVVSGDTRFDRVWEITQHPSAIQPIEKFTAGNKLFVAGSTWPEDEKLIRELILKIDSGWKWIIVPHEVNDTNISNIQSFFKSDMLLFSQAEKSDGPLPQKIMVVDSVGLLSSIYQYATIAYIGGGFGKGIHNTLEAAAYGIPVIFGPNYQKFMEAKMLIENKGARAVNDASELKAAIAFYQQPENIPLGKSNRDWVQKHTGATTIIIEYLEQLYRNQESGTRNQEPGTKD